MSRELQIYLAIWRKAYRQEISAIDSDPIVIRASSQSSALTMRTGLYRALRPYRNGDKFDADLQAAAEVLVVSAPYEVEGGYAIEIRPRMALNELEAQLENLGITTDEVKSDVDIPASLKDLAKSTDRRSTPFYERD